MKIVTVDRISNVLGIAVLSVLVIGGINLGIVAYRGVQAHDQQEQQAHKESQEQRVIALSSATLYPADADREAQICLTTVALEANPPAPEKKPERYCTDPRNVEVEVETRVDRDQYISNGTRVDRDQYISNGTWVILNLRRNVLVYHDSFTSLYDTVLDYAIVTVQTQAEKKQWQDTISAYYHGRYDPHTVPLTTGRQ